MADEDEFAQTRGGDDLFDDEIIPVPAEQQQVSSDVQPQEVQEPVTKPDETPTESPAASPAPTQAPSGPRRGGERGRGRGRGRGGRGGRGSNASGRKGDGGNNKAVEGTPEPESGNVEGEKKVEEKEDDAASESKGSASNGGAEGPRVPAVRGDRSATGGIKKPKLTEEQLTQRMAAAKENAAKLSAAHARAEADQASFLEREKVADEKRRQERANRRVMDSERERNRQRKMNALNGREWDATKQEEDYNPRGGKGGFRRGMHGGVSGYARRDFDDGRPDENPRDNQGGYRGNRGRGRGRGGRGRNNSRGPRRDGWQPDDAFEKPAVATNEMKPPTPAPAAGNEVEFPALPGAKDPPADNKPNWAAAAEKIEPSWSPVEGSTWADEVEAQ